jgi:hypothetical protein
VPKPPATDIRLISRGPTRISDTALILPDYTSTRGEISQWHKEVDALQLMTILSIALSFIHHLDGMCQYPERGTNLSRCHLIWNRTLKTVCLGHSLQSNQLNELLMLILEQLFQHQRQVS